MAQQLIHHDAALRLFFTEEIYLQEETGVLPGLKEIPEPAESGLADDPQVTLMPRNFSYLGKNQRRILILVYDEKEDVSSPEGRDLLRNMVKAIQLTANDFALLNYAAYTDCQQEELFAYFKPQLLLSFGVNAIQLGLEMTADPGLIELNGIQMIFSANLAVLASDKTGKAALWAGLKKLQL